MSDSTDHNPPREGGPSRDGDADGASEPPPETSEGVPIRRFALPTLSPRGTRWRERAFALLDETISRKTGEADPLYLKSVLPVVDRLAGIGSGLIAMVMVDRRSRDDLLFKTIDGNDISLDVIIAYRIDADKAPFILQTVADNNLTLRDKIVRTIARSKPRDIFGELTTEEFYVADSREKQAQRAKDVLQGMLGPMGIVVEKVLTKDYRFNKEYQKAIEDKKVADQQVQKNKSAQHAALEEYKRKLEEAKGEVNKLIADADGVFRKAKIEADVYYEKQKLLAEAIMAEGIAEAKGIQEMNNALAGSGGEALVKLRIAEALQNKKIMLLPVSEGGMNLKTTDINQLINTMGVKSLGGKKQ